MAKRRHKSDTEPHLRIRIDKELRQRLEMARQESDRTLTGEIVFRLKRSFDKEDQAELMRAAAQKGADVATTTISTTMLPQMLKMPEFREGLFEAFEVVLARKDAKSRPGK